MTPIVKKLCHAALCTGAVDRIGTPPTDGTLGAWKMRPLSCMGDASLPKLEPIRGVPPVLCHLPDDWPGVQPPTAYTV
jgi:hypothetical protein